MGEGLSQNAYEGLGATSPLKGQTQIKFAYDSLNSEREKTDNTRPTGTSGNAGGAFHFSRTPRKHSSIPSGSGIESAVGSRRTNNQKPYLDQITSKLGSEEGKSNYI